MRYTSSWFPILVLAVVPACGGSTSVDGSGGSSTGGNGGSATGGSGGSATGGSGGSSTGGSGGACTECGPDGAACCEPGSGCAQANGGLSCNCSASGVWNCGSSMGGAGGGPGCGGGASCGLGFTCCSGVCVNPANDIYNCGACGNSCPGPNPYCGGSGCGMAPCSLVPPPPPEQACCGDSICNAGELCCMVNMGPSFLGCFPPENGTCPKGCPGCVCASPETPIATPSGPQPIASLRQGDLVYSVDHGRVVAVPIRRTQRIQARDHHVMQIVLDSGVLLEISAPHPTADGRTFGELRAGGSLDGVGIRSAKLVPYTHDATFDILPDSDSGTYFAAGMLIGSTMAPALVEPLCVAAP